MFLVFFCDAGRRLFDVQISFSTHVNGVFGLPSYLSLTISAEPVGAAVLSLKLQTSLWAPRNFFDKVRQTNGSLHMLTV